MAINRGRNEGLAIIGGLIFGIFAILYYAIVGDTEEVKAEKIDRIVKANKKSK
jgi:prolipoprotein diacylglyceryltransferase